MNGQEILSKGTDSGLFFDVSSLTVHDLVYRVYFPETLLNAAMPIQSLLPLLFLALLGLLFVLTTFLISRRYYRPIGNISRMIGPDGQAPESKNEFDHIISSIRSLIGERNGYREKMVSISPYAREGVLHSIMSRSVDQQQLKVLLNEHFL